MYIVLQIEYIYLHESIMENRVKNINLNKIKCNKNIFH